MAEETPEGLQAGSNTNDVLQSLTQDISPETRKLVMAMENASEEECKKVFALLESLSKSKEANADEKPSVDTKGKPAVAGGNLVGCNDSPVQSQHTPEVSVHGEAEDHAQKVSENLYTDLNRQGESINGDYSGTENPPNQEGGTNGNSFDADDKNVIHGSELPGLRYEAEKLTDQPPTTGENSAGEHENFSLSEDGDLPELLSNKAEDTCSEIEDGDPKELVGSLPGGNDTSRERTSMEETPSLLVDSRTNLLPESTKTEKCYPKAGDYESSSDDDQMALSSSHSEVTSTESELSDVVVPRDTLAAQTEGANSDLRNVEVTKDDAVIDDDASEVEAAEEPVLERMSSVLSTGTQTSSEPDENLQQNQQSKDQVLNVLVGLDPDALGSILARKDKGPSKLPFCYQPQIVMHEEQPVLVLQPILSSSSSQSISGNVPGVKEGTVKATVPIILPLTSPDIDKATKDAILKQLNGDGAVTSSTSSQSDSEVFLLPNNSLTGAVQPSLNTAHSSGTSDKSGHLSSTGQDTPIIKSTSLGDKTSDGLPEWLPSSELDKAFSAAGGDSALSTENTHASLTFPRVSLPSTNPFAKDLAAAQECGQSEVKVDDLSSLGLDKTLQQSLFGPPSSSSLSPGARPKQLKGLQEPGHVGSVTNPFAPDLTPKKRGRRQEKDVTEHSTEVVVTAEVHPPVSQAAETNRPPHRTHRRRISSESMVTLIETTYADTPASSVELAPAIAQSHIDEPSKITQALEDPKPQLGSREEQADTNTPKLKVPGKVPPIWMPDFACSNCTNCKAKFTIFLRKHHCRGCGKIFCNNCCSQLARFPYMDYKIGRVCPSCTEAIKEVTRAKRKEDLSKQSSSQQSSNRNQGTRKTTKPQKTSGSQTRQPPEGLVISNAQAQSTLTLAPSAQLQSSGTPVSTGTSSNQPVQYQQLPSSSATVQNSGTPVAAVMKPQGSQSLILPVQPANQYMWVPAVQPNMPVVYANPVAPTLQGGPVFVPAASLIPHQAPVVLMTSQPSSTPRLAQATTQAAGTLAGGGQKGAAAVENRTSSGTVSTFTVLPQQVGQSAVQSAQRNNVGSVKQTAISQASNIASSVSSSSVLPLTPSSPQSINKANSVPGKTPLTATYSTQTLGLPSTSSLQQSSVMVTAPSQTLSVGAVSLPQSSPPSVTPAAPSRTQTGLPSTSSTHPSPTPTRNVSLPTQPSTHAAATSPPKGTESQGSMRPREADGSFLVSDETDPSSKDSKPPFRRAGRTITWRYRTQGKSRLQEQRKSLAKDLKDLPNGVTIQAAQDLFVHVKKMKINGRQREVTVWCYQSEGLNKFDHLEVVVMLEVRKKEDIFPEEVLRIYRGILHLATKLGNRFEHGNYLSSNDQFLDSSNDAAFLFVSSEVKAKPRALREMKAPFLYAILVKRPELSAAMFTPSRLLLRLGYEMKSFPFPLWNSRDRRPVNFGNEREDRFFHTVFAMNKYLKNSVPEAMIPGLYVVKEDNKVILQIPNSGQTAVMNLLDRLIKKENQTATVPLISDIPPYVDNCKVVLCNERGGKYVQLFGNTTSTAVVGLGFLMVHLGVDASSPLSFGGELLDDGVLVFFSKAHTQKIRQSLEDKTNCYFYLGDKFDIAHFELRWMQDVNYHVIRKPLKDDSQQKHTFTDPASSATTTVADTPVKDPGAEYYPGVATIDIRYSGYGNEVEILKKVFDDHTKILHILEGNIRQACTEPLMKHENKMKSGEHQELQLRVVLRPSYKKWSVGPSDLPTALIRSLQMALQTVKVPVVSEGELVMSFDVSVVKQ